MIITKKIRDPNRDNFDEWGLVLGTGKNANKSNLLYHFSYVVLMLER